MESDSSDNSDPNRNYNCDDDVEQPTFDYYKNNIFLMPSDSQNATSIDDFIKYIGEYSVKLNGAYHISIDDCALTPEDIREIPTAVDMFNFSMQVYRILVLIDHMFDDYPKYNKVVLNSGKVKHLQVQSRIAQFSEFMVLRETCDLFQSRKRDILSNNGFHWIMMTLGNAPDIFEKLLELLKSRFGDVREVIFKIKPNETLRELNDFKDECTIMRGIILSIIGSVFPEMEDYELDAETLNSDSDGNDEQVGDDGEPYATD